LTTEKDSPQAGEQLTDFVIRYNRTLVIDSDDSDDDFDEEETFTEVDPAKVEPFKKLIIQKVVKNDVTDNLEVQLKVDELL
jgi:hypothetical protein